MTAAALDRCPVTLARESSHPLTRRQRFWLPAAAVLLAAAAPASYAEAGNPLNDTFSISLGGFLLDTDTTIRVDGSLGQEGTEIDASEDLGLQDADRFRVDAYWRMTPRQKLRLMYFDTNAERTRNLERDIEFDGELYEVNLEVTGRIETQVTALSYEFDFLQGDNYELGGTFGIHNLKFEVGLEAEANGVQAARESEAQANGPLPVLGLHGIYRINDKWYLDGGIQYFSISFDPYDGSVTDLTASIVWQATKHFAFGAGWNQFRTKVEVDGDNFDGELKWKYGGARIFVTASF
jgi:hypothetical protein